MYRDTIFATATPPGRSGVAVIRLSGPASDTALQAMTGATALPALRNAAIRTLHHPSTQTLLDHALVLRFAAGASFTGEQSVELHIHGGPAVISAVTDALSTMDGLRLAEPGEFTRRAFDNNRLDLAQIEGLADLVTAETASQHRAALRQYSGALGQRCRAWSGELTQGLALLEATIDFADEEIPDETWAIANRHVMNVRAAIAHDLSTAHPEERLTHGWRIALIGAPNAGKSSLINALAQRDIAITSAIPGTTRDSIEVSLDLRGYPVTLVDTAGIRETGDEIERIGVERSTRAAAEADLRIALHAHDAPLTADITALLHHDDLIVWNKADSKPPPTTDTLAIAAQNGTALPALIDAIADRLTLTDPPADGLLLRQRHRDTLSRALIALDRYADLASDGQNRIQTAPEIAAQDVREAYEQLGRITGERGVERLLDVIFSEFCLGK